MNTHMTLTRAEAEQAIETIEATWPPDEIEFLKQLPPAEQAFIIEGVATLGLKPVPE